MATKQHSTLTGSDLHPNKVDATTGTELTPASQTIYDARWASKATTDAHIANTSNPHAVTKAQVGLGSAENTADLATIAGISPTDGDVIQRVSGSWLNRTIAQLKTALGLTKSDVGLSNVDNT